MKSIIYLFCALIGSGVSFAKDKTPSRKPASASVISGGFCQTALDSDATVSLNQAIDKFNRYIAENTVTELMDRKGVKIPGQTNSFIYLESGEVSTATTQFFQTKVGEKFSTSVCAVGMRYSN